MLLNIIMFIVGVVFGFGFAIWAEKEDKEENETEEFFDEEI